MKIFYIKAQLLTLGAILAGSMAVAQPTLTMANNGTLLGESFTYYIADSNAVNYDLITGPNVTWDYSALLAYGTTADDDVVDPATTPEGSNFPGSAIADNLEGSLIIYRNNMTDSLVSQGYVLTIPGQGDVRVELSNELSLMRYPFTYNDFFTDNFSGDAYVAISPFAIPYTGSVVVEGDGYGTLLLGTNTYTNVLRVLVHETSTADASGLGGGTIPIERLQYYYYEPTVSKFPIFMHVTMIVNGTPSSAVYSRDSLPMITGTNELDLVNAINLYPNPAQNQVTVVIDSKESGAAQIELVNVIGESVLSTSQSLNSGSNQISLDLSNLNTGIYFVNIRNGKHTMTKKLMVK